MWPAVVFVAFVAVVLMLAWWTRDSPRRPRTCCGNLPWPPDDLTDPHPRSRIEDVQAPVEHEIGDRQAAEPGPCTPRAHADPRE